MKKIIFTLILIVSLSFSVEAQEFRGLDKSPMDMIEFPMSNRQPDKSLRVLYSRPQLNGRAVASLTPEGKVWRTGANEATEVTFYKAMKFGGKTIQPGAYTLYTIPGATEWTIILNSVTHVWGAYAYDEAKDVARMTVPVQSDTTALEVLSMTFEAVADGAHLHIGWGNMRLAVPFTK